MLDEGEIPGEIGSGRLVRRLLSNALRFRLAAVSDTVHLKDLRHDADLLPEVREKVTSLLEGFHRDSHLTYDIQGIRDEGADILIRLHSPTGATRFICIQVKSHIELDTHEVVNKLQLQYSASEDAYAPLMFFVVLAADMKDKKRQKIVRAIQSAFKKKKNVAVVEPQYTATFLGLRRSQMDALLTDAFRVGDPIIADARNQLSGMRVREIALALTIASHLAADGAWPKRSHLRNNDWLERVFSTGATSKDMFYSHEGGADNSGESDVDVILREIVAVGDRHTAEGALARLLDVTEEFEIAENETIQLPIDGNQALYCLALEAAVRYELEGEPLVNYLLDLLYPPSDSQ
ncbi:hypothetical protein ABZ738_30425 [Micromonospora sp. NPDC047793]|uniref:hypothetical protein n=1 Tax=Micromonospora sp. NPDC047793 TaxID=3154342 RepID=UPI0033DAD819